MNYLINLSVALMFLAVFPVGCIKAQTVINNDLSTDEAVIAELRKMQAARNSISTGDERLDAKRRAADKLEKKDVCIGRLKASAKVIVIGFFRTDVGCRFDGAFVDSRFHNRDEADLSNVALAALGWEKATREKRENLAKIWVGEGLLAFSKLPYQQVSAVTTGDEIKITVTSQYPAGITSRSAAKRFVFDKEGKLIPGNGY